MLKFINKGSVPEWLKGADCKSVALCYVGSNPTRPNLHFFILSKAKNKRMKIQKRDLEEKV